MRDGTGFDPLSIVERIDASGPCWLWLGYVNNKGYGMVGWEGETYLVHRLMWEALVGPIEEGLQIDHFCRVRHCCNPDHMEPVTQFVNMARIPDQIRGGGAGPNNTCKHGHPLAAAYEWRRPNGSILRVCRECNRLRKAGLL